MASASNQVVRPALEGVAVLLEEDGNSNSQARPALEEGELINDVFLYFVWSDVLR